MDIYSFNDEKKLELANISEFDQEKEISYILAENIHVVHPNFKVIGTEVATSDGGRIDILAIDDDGNLIILELKKDKGNRKVVAQILDYASYISEITTEKLEKIIISKGKDPEIFRSQIDNFANNTDDINHKLYIVTSERDASLKRIIDYLTFRAVPINSIYCKKISDANYIVIDKELTYEEEEERINKNKAPTEYKYVNIRPNDNWDDCKKYGFLCAGGGVWYSSRIINGLEEGDKILAYKKGFGYLGFGIVEEPAVKASDFKINNQSLSELNITTEYSQDIDEETVDYFVKVKWIKTKEEKQGIQEKGLFANQNIVCNIYDNEKGKRTINILKQRGLISD